MKITVDDNTNMINIECDDKKQAVNIVEWILSNKSNATVKCIDDAETIYQKGFSDAMDILKSIADFYSTHRAFEICDAFSAENIHGALTLTSLLDYFDYDLRKMLKLIDNYKNKENINGD